MRKQQPSMTSVLFVLFEALLISCLSWEDFQTSGPDFALQLLAPFASTHCILLCIVLKFVLLCLPQVAEALER